MAPSRGHFCWHMLLKLGMACVRIATHNGSRTNGLPSPAANINMRTNKLTSMTAMRLHALWAMTLTLGGCAVTVKYPVDQSVSTTASVPVEIGLPFAYVANSFRATLNEADITARFTLNNGQTPASAMLDLPPGSYRLDATACWRFNILFVIPAPWPTSGCPTATAAFKVVQPRLVLDPAQVVTTVGTSATISLRADPAPSTALTVTLTPPSVVGSATTATIPAGTAANVSLALQGSAPGTGTLSASASGWLPASAQVQVSPRLSALSPTNAPVGTPLTLRGAGFMGTTQVRFGTQATVTVSPTANGTVIQIPLPASLSQGVIPVTVVSNAQTSNSIDVTVTPPPPADPVLFRATDQSIEIIRFTLAPVFADSQFSWLDALPVTASPGNLSVGLARQGAQLIRASASDLQVFSIGGTAATPTLTLATATDASTGLTGTGTAAAFLPNSLVRGTNVGIEAISLTGSPLLKLGGLAGGSSTHGVALLIDAARLRAWRSMDMGLEAYDLSNPVSPTRAANVIVNMSGSTTGTAMDWVIPGSRLVRATNVGIDIVDTATLPPTRVGFKNTGGASATGVGVAVTGTRVVRATSFGIEVWDISTPSAPRQCSHQMGDLSATGVDVKVIGTVAIRATDESIEAYDIADLSCPAVPSGTVIPAPVKFRDRLDSSSTGVALVVH